MKGFFTNREYSRPKVERLPHRSKEKTEGCESCGLYQTCKSPKMKYSGEGEKKILIVAEAPGEKEDELGVQLVGEAGQLLRRSLKELKLDLDRDFWKINAINCRPPKNRKPTRKELKICRVNVENTIKELKPRFIWLLGATAIESFFLDRYSNITISTWRKKVIPYENTWLVPMYHPSFVLRNNDEKTKQFFSNDLKWAISKMNLPSPVEYSVYDKVKVLTEEKDIVDLLKKIIEEKPEVVFDYETNAISPYRESPVIHSIGICIEKDKAYSFPLKHGSFNYLESKIKSLWKEILLDPEIALINQNIKFEDRWSRVVFGVSPSNWVWDTMVTQHILGSEPGTTSLKFQAHVRWGVNDYESSIEKYMTSADDSGVNRLSIVDTKDLCKYNAIDALVTHKLYLEQKEELRRNRFLSRGRKFFHEGLIAFCDIENNGICVDPAFYKEEERKLTQAIDRLTKRLLNSKDVLLFKEKMGRDISLTSSKDLGILLFDILKLKPVKTTKGGASSVDKESLEEIDSPFTNKLSSIRKLLKIRNTYLAQFRREEYNGKIHPSFNLHIARTYRSACSNPNFQNIPVRDEEAKRITRGGIIPSKGNKLLEMDYASIEVRVACFYTQDPALIRYINDPETDMHYDQAKKLFLANDNEMTKQMRFHTKNGFVFPEFYGSWYKNCALNLWEEARGMETKEKIPLLEHLKSKGVRNYEAFEENVKRVETEFWKEFHVFRTWQEEVENIYLKNGYVDMLFGFRRTGLLAKNKIVNTPIQGTAFHCLLWSLIQICKKAKEEEWKSKVVGQIHDSIIVDLVPEEEEYILKVMEEIMCVKIREEHPFICVPLEVEAEVTKIDGNWNEKEVVKKKRARELSTEEMT